MKIKAKVKNNAVDVKLLIKHPMETGRRKDGDGKLIPAKYITEVEAVHNVNVVFHAEFGTAISKDPYLAFRFKGGVKGDVVTIMWKDSAGASEQDSIVIK